MSELPKAKPIIFTGKSPARILDGSKTETRRVIEPQLPEGAEDVHLWSEPEIVNSPLELWYFHDHKCCCWGPIPFQVGDLLWVREALWVSECGRYFARDAAGCKPPAYDVLAIDGSRVWMWPRYEPTGYRDRDRRFTHAEFPHMVYSWSAEGGQLRSGRWTKDFAVSFGDMDQSVRIRPGQGNAVLQDYTALFRKRRSARFMPRWASRITLERVSPARAELTPISEIDSPPRDCGPGDLLAWVIDFKVMA